jgi:succinoglycan biosynthesis transport protein ExoP
MSETARAPRDHLLILRRRKWYFIVSALLTLVAALVIAKVWPPTYRSEATILVEQAEVPEELVSAIVDGYVERRLESITRRILVTDNLLRIIEQYDLYPEQRQRMPVAAVVEDMRDQIGREIISADVVNPSGGRSQATVAFNVWFDHGQAEVAQRVTNELVTLYLNENLRARRARATETASFIQAERQRAEQRIVELSREFAEFKRANSGSLPEELQYNQQQIAVAQQDLGALRRQEQSLKEREIYLQAQLALLDPHLGEGDGSSPAARLRTMQADLATQSARYSPEHPDVVKLEREVRGLEGLVGGRSGAAGLQRERARLQDELASLRQRYTADHPDLQRTERQLEQIEATIRAAGSGRDGSASSPDNPAYVQLQAQLNVVRSELSAIEQQRAAVTEQVEALRERMARAPMVEREHARLERALADANALRDELSRKEAIARLGQSLETEQKAERFSLIEPPSLPAAPVKPDRGAVVLIGLVLAIGAGLGAVAAAEALDDTVHSPKDISQMFGEAPLAVIPRIVTSADRKRTWSLRAAVAMVVIVGTCVTAWWLHTRYAPLDVAWYGWQRRALAKVESYFPPPPPDQLDPAEAR